MKRILSVILLTMALLSVFTIQASATSANRYYRNIISKEVNPNERKTIVEKKDNSTSAYVHYQGGLPIKYIVVIYGDSQRYGAGTDCTTYEYYSGVKRPSAFITRGTKGFVRQDVYEKYGPNCYAGIYGDYCGYIGMAEGAWSPDSVPEDGVVDLNA